MRHSQTRHRWVRGGEVLALFAMLLPVGGQATSAPAAMTTASAMIEAGGAPGGIISVVGQDDAELAVALSQQGTFVVQALYRTEQRCRDQRRAIRKAGVYGRVSADVFEGGRLPYGENLLNLVVVDNSSGIFGQALSAAEVERVLAPLGTAVVGRSGAADPSAPWVKTLRTALQQAGLESVAVLREGGIWIAAKKPWPADIDEWTHFLHGADGNPVANDRMVGPPKHLQWVSGPRWLRSHETDSSVSTIVTAAGRLFYIIDRAPISVTGNYPLPDKWFLVAQDAFNGVELWQVPIRRWGWREWKETWFTHRPGDLPLNIRKRLVAVKDRVYVTLGYKAPVSELDARTGKILRTFADTAGTGELLYLDGALVLAVLDDDGTRIARLDLADGKLRWTTREAYRGTTVDYVKFSGMNGRVKPAKLDPAVDIATDGKVVAFIDGPDIVAVDYQTGAQCWRTPFPTVDSDLGAGGIRSQGNLWNGTMIVSNDVVLHASPGQLAGFAAATGKQLWTQPKRYIGHLWYEWKDIFVIDGVVWTWGDDLMREDISPPGAKRRERSVAPQSVNGYDIHTGKLVKKVSLGRIFVANHHHRCYRNKATLRYILASRRGTEFVDLEKGEHTVDNWVRGTCHVGMMPANGLQYAPPHPCACYIDEKLNGMNVLAPAIPERYKAPAGLSRPPLERGPAYGAVAETTPAGAADWPTFRCDGMRTGSVATRVPDGLAPRWRKEVGSRVSPPVVVGDRAYVALVDEHHVLCLDTADGSTRWEFGAGGRIDSPPTYHRGTILFGSADGWVYCVRAGDGELVWRYRAAPQKRLIGAYGQLESVWPVHGSVLVQDGAVYATAGRTSELDGGIRLYAIDAATGELRHHTELVGPHYQTGDFQANYRLPMGALPDILMGDGQSVYMRAHRFDPDLNPIKGAPDLQVRSGFLDDTYFKRTPWVFGKGGYGRLIVHDSRSVFYCRMFDSLRGLDPTVYFTPGRKGYLLFARNMQKQGDAWSERLPVRIRAMVVADQRLFVAGPPDVIDPKDPLGSFEGREGGQLCVFDAGTGEKLVTRTLPSPPVFNGAAAAGGRLYITDEDGALSCFGAP